MKRKINYIIVETMTSDDVRWEYKHPELYKTREDAIGELLVKAQELKQLGHHISSVTIEQLDDCHCILIDESANIRYYVFEKM